MWGCCPLIEPSCRWASLNSNIGETSESVLVLGVPLSERNDRPPSARESFFGGLPRFGLDSTGGQSHFNRDSRQCSQGFGGDPPHFVRRDRHCTQDRASVTILHQNKENKEGKCREV